MTHETRIYPMPDEYDHDRVIWLDKIKKIGSGFIPKKNNPEKRIALVECPTCLKENRITYVLKGKCAFCGFDANKEEKI